MTIQAGTARCTGLQVAAFTYLQAYAQVSKGPVRVLTKLEELTPPINTSWLECFHQVANTVACECSLYHRHRLVQLSHDTVRVSLAFLNDARLLRVDHAARWPRR